METLWSEMGDATGTTGSRRADAGRRARRDTTGSAWGFAMAAVLAIHTPTARRETDVDPVGGVVQQCPALAAERLVNRAASTRVPQAAGTGPRHKSRRRRPAAMRASTWLAGFSTRTWGRIRKREWQMTRGRCRRRVTLSKPIQGSHAKLQAGEENWQPRA